MTVLLGRIHAGCWLLFEFSWCLGKTFHQVYKQIGVVGVTGELVKSISTEGVVAGQVVDIDSEGMPSFLIWSPSTSLAASEWEVRPKTFSGWGHGG